MPTGRGSGRRDERTVTGIVQRSSVMQGTRDRARAERVMNGVRPDAGVAACKICCGIANGQRTIAAETRPSCRSGYRRPATEVPSAAGKPRPAAARAAKMRPTAAEAPGARATEMAATSEVAAAHVSTAMASASAAATAASAAAASGIDRARERD